MSDIGSEEFEEDEGINLGVSSWSDNFENEKILTSKTF